MDKSKVLSILAPYSPPLSLSQMEAIVEEIVLATQETVEASTPVEKGRRSRSRG